ncbi:hypothetical protein CC2G_000075 [Coprinopsis cinerea AmutBmut pab1-1]|nr:hypothetical protein CC2G_000075 [Coprinopsis cinerea AmutBmut pab1-1]
MKLKAQKSLRPLSEPLQLSCLPHEILVEIMKNAEWDGILVLRKVAQSTERRKNVRYFSRDIARPPFRVPSSCQNLCNTRHRAKSGKLESLDGGPVCAGLWPHYPAIVTFFTFEGTVYYGDPLDLASTLTPLLFSPFKGPLPAGACVSVDVLATQGIPIDPDIPAADATWESRLFPLAFRLAVCRRQSKTGFIEVYDIMVQIQDGDVRYSSTKLKSMF